MFPHKKRPASYVQHYFNPNPNESNPWSIVEVITCGDRLLSFLQTDDCFRAFGVYFLQWIFIVYIIDYLSARVSRFESGGSKSNATAKKLHHLIHPNIATLEHFTKIAYIPGDSKIHLDNRQACKAAKNKKLSSKDIDRSSANGSTSSFVTAFFVQRPRVHWCLSLACALSGSIFGSPCTCHLRGYVLNSVQFNYLSNGVWKLCYTAFIRFLHRIRSGIDGKIVLFLV